MINQKNNLLEQVLSIPIISIKSLRSSEEHEEEQLKQFFLDSKPVIIRGDCILEEFKEVMEWSVDDLVENIPNSEFSISYRDENEHVIGAESNTKMKLFEFIEKCGEIGKLEESCIRYYLSGSNLLENGNTNDELAQLRSDASQFKQFIEENLSETKRLSSLGFWIGLDGQKTHLHFDCVNNMMLQIRGSKTFLLVSPNDHLKLNLHSYKSAKGQDMDGEIYRFSQFNIFNSEIPKVQIFKGTLERGDCILIPLGWFHAVYSKGEETNHGSFNIALNAFWNATDREWDYWKHLKLFKNNY